MRWAALLLIAVAGVSAAEPISETRLQLAREMFEAMGGVERLNQSLEILFGSIDQTYDQFYEQLATDPAFSDPEKRERFLSRLDASRQEFRASLDLALSSELSSTAIEVMLPIYAELYTDDELRQLIEFFRSPLGRKLVETQPERLQRGMQELTARFVPLMQKSLKQALAQERARLLAQNAP